LQGKNEITDELAMFGSNRALVPIVVFLQKLHAPSISWASTKATKVAEPSQETPPQNEVITESPEVMEIHSDWHTPFRIYLRTRGLLEEKVKCKQLHHRAGKYTLVNDELF
jgi:hypothetical protein